MRKKTPAFVLSFLLVHFAQSQSPFKLDWRKDLTITAIGLGSAAGAYWISQGVDPLTLEEINDADRAGLNVLDRVATRQISFKAHKASNYLLYGSHLLPCAFLAGRHSNSEFAKIAVMAGETFIVTTGLTALTKNASLRSRPYVYNEDTPLTDKQTKNARYSFFSGHTSATAAMGFFVARVYAGYHPDSKWKPLLWTGAIALPVVTGVLRVKGGKHYPTDVAAGLIVGGAIGYLIPHLHKNNNTKLSNLNLTGTGNGALVHWQF